MLTVPPERKNPISCRGISIPCPFSRTKEEAKWNFVRSDCNGPGKLTYGTILDILGKYSKKRMEWTRSRRTKERGKVTSTTKVIRTFVVHNLRSVEIYLRLCAIIQTGAPEAQLAQLSSWRYGRGARTIYFAGFFSDE